jgi:fluoride exporter
MNIEYLWVAIGGAFGSVGRFWIGGLVASKFGETFPFGTLVINVTGSFLIGVFFAMISPEGGMDPRSRVVVIRLLMTGLCGGYTTFSSFSLQTFQLMQDRQWLYAGGNILLSVILCMVAVWLGYMLGATFNSMKGH